jgi:tetratricopeptide (TPR) repeat protein
LTLPEEQLAMTALTALRPRRLRPALVLATAAAVAATSYAASTLHAGPFGGRPPAAAPAVLADRASQADRTALAAPGAPLGTATTLQQIDHSISVWSANLQREGRDFYAATTLSQLYESRARLTGDVADYGRAREASERALASAPTQTAARVAHARILAALHDFAGARSEALAILRDDPSQLAALATAGDAALELGDVAAARSAFQSLAAAAPGPAVTARLSRLAFIEGRPAEARALARGAFAAADDADETGPGLSWYAYVAGATALSAGDPTDAASWFDRAIDLWPDSYLAHAGSGRALAALGRSSEAIKSYQAAIAIAPQPDAVAALGDLEALSGNDVQARQAYDTVEAIGHLAALNEQVFNRQLVLFSVNHERDLGAALRLAQDELESRKDVYGYDAVAWALLANGRVSEAAEAMRSARAFGTDDALLDAHDGLIQSALGNGDAARSLLGRALSRPGSIDPLLAQRITTALDGLR